MVLNFSTNHAGVDEMIRGIIELYEMSFPERIRGYYLSGSFANGNAVASSDLDGTVLFKGSFADADEEARANALTEACARLMPIENDVWPECEANFTFWARPNFHFDSRLIWGADGRSHIYLPAPADYARLVTHRVFHFLARVRGVAQLRYPLLPPNPSDPYLGYTRRTIQQADGTELPGTKALINCVGKPAHLIVSLKTGQFIANKQATLNAYRTQINDEWLLLLEGIYDKCREAWGYHIPKTAVAQQELRALCEQTLAFENHFMRFYRDFALTQLDPATDASIWLPVADAHWLNLETAVLQQAIDAGQYETKTENGRLLVHLPQLQRHQTALGLTRFIFPNDTALTDALAAWQHDADPLLTPIITTALTTQTSP